MVPTLSTMYPQLLQHKSKLIHSSFSINLNLSTAPLSPLTPRLYTCIYVLMCIRAYVYVCIYMYILRSGASSNSLFQISVYILYIQRTLSMLNSFSSLTIFNTDSAILSAVQSLPPGSLWMVLLLAVLLAPLIYRLRLRVNRWLRRLAWFSAGVVFGLLLD